MTRKLLVDGALGTALLWVYCIFDAVTSDTAAARNLPKGVWVVLVIILPDVGSLLWLVAGRSQGPTRSLPYKGNTGIPAEYDRPGRAVAASPDDDATFLASLRARTEQQRTPAAEASRCLRAREDEAPPN